MILNKLVKRDFISGVSVSVSFLMGVFNASITFLLWRCSFEVLSSGLGCYLDLVIGVRSLTRKCQTKQNFKKIFAIA